MDKIKDAGDELTVWCSSVVLILKKDGESIWVSLDKTDENKYIKIIRYVIFILRELEIRLVG